MGFLETIAIGLVGAGALGALVYSILSYGARNALPKADSVTLIKDLFTEIRAYVTCLTFMLIGIGLKLFFC